MAARPYENPSYKFPFPSACGSGCHRRLLYKPHLQAYPVSTAPTAVNPNDQTSTQTSQARQWRVTHRCYVPNVVRSSMAHAPITVLLPFQSTHARQHTIASPTRIFEYGTVSRNKLTKTSTKTNIDCQGGGGCTTCI